MVKYLNFWQHIMYRSQSSSESIYVVSSTSINMFKNSIDSYLHAQDVFLNWKADLTGTGDSSENRLNWKLRLK